MTEFAERLKAARAAAGLTQKAVSEKLGIPLNTIKSWEKSHNTPTAFTQAAVLDALKKEE